MRILCLLQDRSFQLERRHMFFDGVFDNLEGMKHIADGECSVLTKVRLLTAPAFSSHIHVHGK